MNLFYPLPQVCQKKKIVPGDDWTKIRIVQLWRQIHSQDNNFASAFDGLRSGDSYYLKALCFPYLSAAHSPAFKKLEAFCKRTEEDAISHYSLRRANITRLLHSEVQNSSALYERIWGPPPNKANSLEQVFVTNPPPPPPAQDHRQSEPEHEAIKVACAPTVTH